MENIETERLRFRPWRESDAQDLFRWASDPDIGERAGWPPHKTLDDSLTVIRTIFSNDHTWALELKQSSQVIGCMGWADHFVDNPASGRVMQKCGFRDTGRTNLLSRLYHSDTRPVKIYLLAR